MAGEKGGKEGRERRAGKNGGKENDGKENDEGEWLCRNYNAYVSRIHRSIYVSNSDRS